MQCCHDASLKAQEGQNKQTRDTQRGIPKSEFDHAAANGKTTDSKHNITIIEAVASIHRVIFCTTIRRKGGSDECVVQAFLNFITSLGQKAGSRVSKCIQQTGGTRRYSLTAEGSKCSLCQAEHGHLSLQEQIRTWTVQFGEQVGGNTTSWTPQHRSFSDPHDWTRRLLLPATTRQTENVINFAHQETLLTDDTCAEKEKGTLGHIDQADKFDLVVRCVVRA